MGVKYVSDFEFPAEAGFTGSAGVQHVRGYARGGAVKAKVEKTMHEFKQGDLHSGSKTGPKVTNRKQAVAIALSQARKAGAHIPMRKAEGGLAVRRKGVPVPAAKPIIERTPPKPMQVTRQSPEAGDTDPRVGRKMAPKPLVPGRDNYAEGGPVKKGLGGVIDTVGRLALGPILSSALLGKKKKKDDQTMAPPVNAAQADAMRTGGGMKKGGAVKFEGSPRDEREDRQLAKKHGMSAAAWEKSPMDVKHDRQQSKAGLRKGGRVNC